MDGSRATAPAETQGEHASDSRSALPVAASILRPTQPAFEVEHLAPAAIRLGSDMRIMSANDAATKVLGCRRDLVLGMAASLWLCPDILDHIACGPAAVLAPGEIRRGDGTRAAVLVAMAPFQDVRGLTVMIYPEVASAVGTVAVAAAHRGDLTRAMSDLAGHPDVDGALRAIARSIPVVVGADRALAVTIRERSMEITAVHGLEMLEGAALLRELTQMRLPSQPRSVEFVVTLGGVRHNALVEPIDGHEIEALMVVLRPADVVFTEEDRQLLADCCMVARGSLEMAAALEREAEHVREMTERSDVQNVFLTAVSHELRTPLTNVRGIAQTLVSGGGRIDDETREHLLTRLMVNAERLDALLRDLLDLDRLRRGTAAVYARDIDLRAVVFGLVETTDVINRRDVALDLNAVRVHAEAGHVERILDNLIVNADRYSPAGTSIEIDIRTVPGGAQIRVSDHGEGVRPDLRERIFEPFTRGDSIVEHSPGVGIGLTLVRRLAELNGGRAWVTDREDGTPGACFHVYLPRARTEGADKPTALEHLHAA